MKPLIHRAVVFLALLALHAHFFSVRAQGTAFTYQGRLNSGGSAANGWYDFRLRLDADPEGNAILATLLTNAVPVSNGLFMVTLDFGPGWFTGPGRWLEVDVRTNNPGNTLSYNVLTPFPALTPAPYAVFANTASNVSGSISAGQITGPVPLSVLNGITSNQLDTATWRVATNLNGGNAAVATNVVSGIAITNAVITDSVFAGDGSGLVNVPAPAASYFWAYNNSGYVVAANGGLPLTTVSANKGFEPLGNNAVTVLNSGVYLIDFEGWSTTALATVGAEINGSVIPGSTAATVANGEFSHRLMATLSVGSILAFINNSSFTLMLNNNNPTLVPTFSVTITKIY